MKNLKKSFLIYMDSHVHVMVLDAEQRGELFAALFWYAARVAEKGYQDVTAAAAQLTRLTPEAKMAFRFMAEDIQRDTVRWLEKQANYQAAARRRALEREKIIRPVSIRGIDVYPDREELEKLEGE